MEKSLIEQIETWAGIFSKIAFPLVVLILGLCLISAYGAKETRLKYIDIAVGVLNENPSPEKAPLREWAIVTLNLHADRKIPLKAKKVLKTATLHDSPVIDETPQADTKENSSHSESDPAPPHH